MGCLVSIAFGPTQGGAIRVVTHTSHQRSRPGLGLHFSIVDRTEHPTSVRRRGSFDTSAAAEGVKTLKAYRKDWDEDRGAWRNKPRHDFSSHGADGFRIGVAIPYREMAPPKDPKLEDLDALAAHDEGAHG
jgi:hypothetical protein